MKTAESYCACPRVCAAHTMPEAHAIHCSSLLAPPLLVNPDLRWTTDTSLRANFASASVFE